MFETTKKPVFVYQSSDPGAPVLESAAGSLKVVLKACLITGYGEDEHRKESLGWEMPFEEANRAAFRSKVGHRRFLSIDNRQSKYAIIVPYENMTSLDEATGAFCHSTATYRYFAHNPSSARWLLVGHENAFILAVSSQSISQILYFGDVPSLKLLDSGNTVFINTADYNATTFEPSNFGIKKPYLAKSVLDVDGAKAECAVLSLFYNYGKTYPDLITDGLAASEIYLTESDCVRALLPGLVKVGHNLTAFNEYTRFNLGDSSEWAKLCLYSSKTANACFLVNLTEWEA